MNLLEKFVSAVLWPSLSVALAIFAFLLALTLYRRFQRLERRVDTLERRSHEAPDRSPDRS